MSNLQDMKQQAIENAIKRLLAEGQIEKCGLDENGQQLYRGVKNKDTTDE